MKEKTINLYEYHELSPKAKEKALNKWRETNNDPLMQSHMINLLKEKLEEYGIKYDTDSIDVRYSLSNCQGDGFMFIGLLEYGSLEVRITHNDNHYYHSHTASFDYLNDEPSEKEMAKFENLYHKICGEMETIGYDYIEERDSESSFIEECEANDWTFREDGTMENE